MNYHQSEYFSFTIYISYQQFMVWDDSIIFPGLKWTQSHTNQGFARQESVANFTTLADSGFALLRVFFGAPLDPLLYDRLIAIPFLSLTGIVNIAGPEENEPLRYINVEPSHYRLYVAQSLQPLSNGPLRHTTDKYEQYIDLFLEKSSIPYKESQILKADPALSITNNLIESAPTMEV